MDLIRRFAPPSPYARKASNRDQATPYIVSFPVPVRLCCTALPDDARSERLPARYPAAKRRHTKAQHVAAFCMPPAFPTIDLSAHPLCTPPASSILLLFISTKGYNILLISVTILLIFRNFFILWKNIPFKRWAWSVPVQTLPGHTCA